MHQNMSLGSNGVGQVHSLRKILKRLLGTYFCINCNEFHVVMKHCQMHPNNTRRTETWVYGPMWWIGSVHCKKFRCDFAARNFALFAPAQPVLYRASCSNETIQNAPKHYKTHQFMSLVSNGVDRVRLLRKSLIRFHGTNFLINCTSSTRFAPSLVQ